MVGAEPVSEREKQQRKESSSDSKTAERQTEKQQGLQAAKADLSVWTRPQDSWSSAAAQATMATIVAGKHQ